MDIKPRKLSYKKVQLNYKANIYFTNGDIIDTINLKVRYKLNESQDRGVMLYPKQRVYQIMSMSYGIKMKNILTKTSTTEINMDFDGKNITLDKLIEGFCFVDPVWYRDH